MDRADVRTWGRHRKAGPRRVSLGALAVFAAQLATVAGWEAPASAATITVVYDPTVPGAIDPCSQLVIDDESNLMRHLRACAGGIDRTPDAQVIVEAAAAWFGDIFEDDHSVTIRWAWLQPEETLPDGRVLERDDAGRPTEGQIRLPSDSNYYYDPTPEADEEFDMRPRLYRTTHPEEQARAFDGSPPEVLEVSYVGRTTQNDLLSEVLHELGHALGLSGGPTVGPGPACDGTNDPFFRPDPELLAGAAVGIRAFDRDDADEQCVHLELGGIDECKTDPGQNVGGDPDVPSTLGDFTLFDCASHQGLFWVSEFPSARVRPGIVDLLALAEAGGWVELDLPRKYTAGQGDWTDPSTWIGGRAPDAADDVYIVNTAAGTKVWDTPPSGTSVANLYVSDENTVRAVGDPLVIGERVTVAGPDSTAGPLRLHEPGDGDGVGTTALARLQVGTPASEGVVRAARGVIEPGGALDLGNLQSRAEVGTLDNHGVIVGHGTVETSNFANSGRIRSVGGLAIATPAFDPDDEVAEPPLLDLDGSSEGSAELLAVEGPLFLLGPVADAVEGSTEVGPGWFILFAHGWEQEPGSLLLLDGTTLPAAIFGESQLAGNVAVNGVGQFGNSLTLTPTAEVRLSIAGTAPGTGHDVLDINAPVALGGTLNLEVAEGYQPAPLDSFVVATYASRSGEFSQIVGTELEGGLVLVPDYQDDQLVLVAGFAGASADDANCKGAARSAQIEAHGSMKNAAQFHGLSVMELQDAIRAYCAG